MTGSADRQVVVIGAGIVGSSCALWLQQSGFSVTLVDRDEPGAGTSSGNACSIADYACIPVNNPSLFYRLPAMMLSSDSPLHVDIGFALRELPWMLQFLRNCTPRRVQRITTLLAQLLAKSYEGLQPLIDITGSESELVRDGHLTLYLDDKEYQSAASDNRKRKQLGVHFDELSTEEIRELEPALKPRFHRGLLTEHVARVRDPQTLVGRFVSQLTDNGGTFKKAAAQRVLTQGDHIDIQLDNGEILQAGQVVIASGAFSTQLQGTGIEHLPLGTERGYHLQFEQIDSPLKRIVSWADAGFYAVPRDKGIRLAGTVEIAGLKPESNQKRLDYIQRRGKQMLDLPDQPTSSWLGFRPTLPDSLPVIGHSPLDKRILLAFGHQHLGLTLAGITGKLISELASHNSTSLDLSPFNASRF